MVDKRGFGGASRSAAQLDCMTRTDQALLMPHCKPMQRITTPQTAATSFACTSHGGLCGFDGRPLAVVVFLGDDRVLVGVAFFMLLRWPCWAGTGLHRAIEQIPSI